MLSTTLPSQEEGVCIPGRRKNLWRSPKVRRKPSVFEERENFLQGVWEGNEELTGARSHGNL